MFAALPQPDGAGVCRSVRWEKDRFYAPVRAEMSVMYGTFGLAAMTGQPMTCDLLSDPFIGQGDDHHARVW